MSYNSKNIIRDAGSIPIPQYYNPNVDNYEVLQGSKGSTNFRLVDNSLRENPYSTSIGQEVVSIQENFWVRLAREGKKKDATLSGFALTTSTDTAFEWKSILEPDAGVIYFPRVISVSCTVDAELAIKLHPNTFDETEVVYNAYVKAYTPFNMYFDGEISIFSHDIVDWNYYPIGVYIGAKTATAGAKISGFVYGVGVTWNA